VRDVPSLDEESISIPLARFTEFFRESNCDILVKAQSGDGDPLFRVNFTIDFGGARREDKSNNVLCKMSSFPFAY